MKKKVTKKAPNTALYKLLVIIAIIVVIGFSMSGFFKNEEQQVELNGTAWMYGEDGSDTFRLTFDSPSYQLYYSSVFGVSRPQHSGTYSISGSTVTFAIDNNYGDGYYVVGSTITAKVSGNTLKFSDSDMIYKKQ